MRDSVKLIAFVSYSLGDAIDCKQRSLKVDSHLLIILLLARGRDRLEKSNSLLAVANNQVSYSLGDAIDWKHHFAVPSV